MWPLIFSGNNLGGPCQCPLITCTSFWSNWAFSELPCANYLIGFTTSSSLRLPLRDQVDPRSLSHSQSSTKAGGPVCCEWVLEGTSYQAKLLRAGLCDSPSASQFLEDPAARLSPSLSPIPSPPLTTPETLRNKDPQGRTIECACKPPRILSRPGFVLQARRPLGLNLP